MRKCLPYGQFGTGWHFGHWASCLLMQDALGDLQQQHSTRLHISINFLAEAVQEMSPAAKHT